jgi:hypothetical protein
MRAALERPPDVGLALRDEVAEEGLAPVAVDPVLREDQAQGRGRDDGLLDRHVRVALRGLQEAVRVAAEAERSRRESRELSRVPVGEGDHRAVGREVLQAVERIGHEARLGLLAVGDHGGARALEALDRLANRLVLEPAKLLGRQRARAEGDHAFEERLRSRDAADGFGRDHQELLGLGGRRSARAL